MPKTLSPKDKRKLKAYRKRYKEGKDNETIAEEVGRSQSTVEKYFSEKEKEEFKQIFDPEEIEFMRFQTMQEIKESKTLSKDYISRAIEHEDVDPHALLRASKQEREAIKDFIHMMQEINVFQKPKERKEVQKTETNDTRKKLAEYYQQKKEEETSNEQD